MSTQVRALGAARAGHELDVAARHLLLEVVHVDPIVQAFDAGVAVYGAGPEVCRDVVSSGIGHLAELAQALAMDQRCHVWSAVLRDFDWYAPKIASLRKQFPHYRIALFYITPRGDGATARRDARARVRRQAKSRYIP